MLGVATCFCCNGVVFHTEKDVRILVREEVPKFVRPRLWLLDFAAME